MTGILQIGKGLSKTTAWDDRSAAHLLSRALFGYTKGDIDFALSFTIDDYVDNYLLADTETPQSPGFWVTDTSNSNSNIRGYELTFWWFNLMLNQGHSFREKMVLFWHNHFVSEISVVDLPQRMYWQNKLFRDNAFGNFKDFTKAITVDPAMLIYLDGRRNRASDPNENYARELLELFTVGIGNYSETDISEAARALTGWEVEDLSSNFDPERFDSTTKTFMGQTGNFNHEDIIDIIFTRDAAANFLCRKLFKEFVHFDINETYVTQLAQIFRENNYELKPLLSTLLKSTMFYSDEIIGAKIKSPVELIIGVHKQFKLENPDYEYLRVLANQLSQTVFSPPNVAGWPGDKIWISTNTLPARNTFTDRIVNGSRSELNIIEYARSFENAENAIQFVDDVIKVFLQYPVSENRKDYLLEILLDGAAVYDWSTFNENAEARLKEFFKALLRLSEYQLS